MDGALGPVHHAHIMEDTKPRHYLRAWREEKNLTQEKVVEHVGLIGADRPPSDDPLSYPKTFTRASLSRIENGKQPYNQTLLEILAEIYQTDVASLLMRDPSDREGIWSLWDKLKDVQRKTVLDMLEGLVGRTGTRA